MEHRKFNNILKELVAGLTAAKVGKLKDALDDRGDLDEVCALIDRQFEKHKKCPHCGKKHLQRWGMESGLTRWMCVDCKRTLHALTGTPPTLALCRAQRRWLICADAKSGWAICDH